MHYFLGMEVLTREVCSKYPEEVQDDGMQGYDHTYVIEPEAIECCFIRSGWCYDVSLDDWVLDVPDEYNTVDVYVTSECIFPYIFYVL